MQLIVTTSTDIYWNVTLLLPTRKIHRFANVIDEICRAVFVCLIFIREIIQKLLIKPQID